MNALKDLIGLDLGRYHIIEKLGEGGMATVYKAFDTRLEREVAIKVLRTDRLTEQNRVRTLKRFSIEAKKTALLHHPNIIPVTNFGEQDGTPYLVMRYVKGVTLKKWADKPIGFSEAARVLMPIAKALEKAHKNNLIHRDVKPSNIIIGEDGTPYLTDFGIAKVLDEEQTMEGLTLGGMVVGTPEYMAPEQWEGKRVDGRADIYALGVVFYELITGRPPFKADTLPAIMVQVLRDPLPKPSQFVPELPEQVEQMLYKTLAKKPENRFQNMAELVNLFQILSTFQKPSETGVEEGNENQNAFSKKSRLFGFVGLFIVVIAGVFVGLLFAKKGFPEKTQNTQFITDPTLTTTPIFLPTQTGKPTSIATVTEIPEVINIYLLQDADCWFGPSQDYSVVKYLDAGSQSSVLGVSEDQNWINVLNGDTNCWIEKVNAPTDFDSSGFPVVEAPVGVPDIIVTGITHYQIAVDSLSYQYTICVSVSNIGDYKSDPFEVTISNAPLFPGKVWNISFINGVKPNNPKEACVLLDGRTYYTDCQAGNNSPESYGNAIADPNNLLVEKNENNNVYIDSGKTSWLGFVFGCPVQ